VTVSDETMWHVTLTVGGAAMDSTAVRDALERLAAERPFLLSGRYDVDRAELRYWEEAPDCADACAMALRLWPDHKASAGLPPWQVLALEVVARDVHQARDQAVLVPAGAWRPF
jgi:hypothetical protein